MKRSIGFGLALLCFVVGFSAMKLMMRTFHARRTESSTAVIPTGYVPSVTSISIGEAIQSHPELVMEDLRSNPYLILTAEEIEELGAKMDLTKDRDRLLLNGVASMELRAKLWEAAIRNSIGKIPLEQLTDLAREARTRGEPILNPIFENLDSKAKTQEVLATPWGEKLISDYLTYRSDMKGSLSDGLLLIPRDKNFQQLQQAYVESWIERNHEPADLAAVFNIPAHDSLGTDFYSSIAYTVWCQSAPENKGEVLEKIAALPATQRNRVLITVASAVPGDHPEQLTTILARVSSFDSQERIVENWLQESPAAAEMLLDSLKSQGDRQELAKIAASVSRRIKR